MYISIHVARIHTQTYNGLLKVNKKKKIMEQQSADETMVAFECFTLFKRVKIVLSNLDSS